MIKLAIINHGVKTCRFQKIFKYRNTELLLLFSIITLSWKRCGSFDQRNYIEKLRGNDVEFCRNLFFDVLA